MGHPGRPLKKIAKPARPGKHARASAKLASILEAGKRLASKPVLSRLTPAQVKLVDDVVNAYIENPHEHTIRGLAAALTKEFDVKISEPWLHGRICDRRSEQRGTQSPANSGKR